MPSSPSLRLVHAGRFLLVLATLAYGLLCFVFSDFVSGLQPVPAGIGARLPLAWLTGAALVACAVALAIRRTGASVALLLAAIHASWALLLCLPLVASSKALFGTAWIGCFENVAFAGTFLALAAASRGPGAASMSRGWIPRLTALARPLYGSALVVFALSHFRYPDFVAALVPAWIPAKLAMAWLTGAGHLATALAVFSGVAARIACLCHALMCFTIFAVLHIPRVGADPSNRGEITSMFVALALCGASLVFAARSARRGDRSATTPSPL